MSPNDGDNQDKSMADEQPQFTPDVVAYPAWRWTCPQCKAENYIHASVESEKLYITLNDVNASCFLCSHPVELVPFHEADDCDPAFKVENRKHDYDVVGLDGEPLDDDDDDDDDDSDVVWCDDDYDDEDDDDSVIEWDDDFDDEDDDDDEFLDDEFIDDDEPEH